ncbi:hypothetical protein QA649_30970 [Bradyrhizobium sp. CB1717]|uniref:hypothetical protein n=1 Tax=Bradyrhizobium sp. CB1717 TaxID=3039154 RepID=UPI0024B12D5D|nr:hypothetical protein [Bradyrhizobium sp. CB1717]WFU22479.1 hypothetical protein QA649_30970 [Bradyrhizobium sp. CB1717]
MRIFLILGLMLLLQQGSAFASPRNDCAQPDDWSTSADADRARLYVNRSDEVFYFEFRPEGDGGSLQGNPYWVSMPSEPGRTYNLGTTVRTGNGTRFRVEIRGAVDARTGQPLKFVLGPQKTKAVRSRVKATAQTIDVYVRGEHYIKFWSFVGPTKLCRL